MPLSIPKNLLFAILLFLSAGVSTAADKKSEAPEATSASPKSTEKIAKEKPAATPAKKQLAPAVKVKLIDINSATKVELQRLPGISDALADKIIASRPYPTKSHLVTKNVLSTELFLEIKKLIVATQPESGKTASAATPKK